MTQRAIPCMFMRGGTSRGAFFLLEDLPADPEVRDRVLLAAMGSPDPRQIDGLGGATTVTSKLAMVSPSQRPGIDVDYRFAQVWLDKAIVDKAPSCGNMLAGVGPFAIERGLVTPDADETRVRIFDVNTGSRIEAIVQTPGGTVTYAGDQRMDGVPGTAAPVVLSFSDIDNLVHLVALPRRINFVRSGVRVVISYLGTPAFRKIGFDRITHIRLQIGPCDVEILSGICLYSGIVSMLAYAVSDDALANVNCPRFRSSVPNYINAFHAIKVRVVKVYRIQLTPNITDTLHPLQLHYGRSDNIRL